MSGVNVLNPLYNVHVHVDTQSYSELGGSDLIHSINCHFQDYVCSTCTLPFRVKIIQKLHIIREVYTTFELMLVVMR